MTIVSEHLTMRATLASILTSLLLIHGAAAADKTPENDFFTFQQALGDAEIWSGGPDAVAEKIGRNGIATMIEAGLSPTDKVLDIGAGSLRLGWWILRFVEPGNYYAIEPSRVRIDTAAELADVDINIYYNTDWQF